MGILGGLTFGGPVTVVEKRALGKKTNRDDIWRWLIKASYDGGATELIVTEEQHREVKTGGLYMVAGRVMPDLNGTGLFVDRITLADERKLLEARLAALNPQPPGGGDSPRSGNGAARSATAAAGVS